MFFFPKAENWRHISLDISFFMIPKHIFLLPLPPTEANVASYIKNNVEYIINIKHVQTKSLKTFSSDKRPSNSINSCSVFIGNKNCFVAKLIIFALVFVIAVSLSPCVLYF